LNNYNVFKLLLILAKGIINDAILCFIFSIDSMYRNE